MKKLTLFFILAAVAVSAFALTLNIGTETLPQRYPLGSTYGYEATAMLYTDAELGNSNLRISALGWYADSTMAVPVPTNIYLKPTTATSMTSVTWGTMLTGAEMVYDGIHSGVTIGWNTFTFNVGPSPTFDLDNGRGVIVIVLRSYGGGGTDDYYNGGKIRSSLTVGDFQQQQTWMRDNNLGSNTTGVINYAQRPNLQVTYTTYTTAVPSPALLISPADGALNVPMDVTLNWVNGGGLPTGYKLYLGTDNPPSNIVNGTNLGNVLTYDPNPLPNTTYYWKIVPTNALGDALDCPVWNFSTSSGQVDLWSPLAGAVDQSIENLQFTWSSVAGATSYKIKIGTAPGGTDIINLLTVTSPYVYPGTLAYSTTYYWSVHAVFPGVEVPSAERTFTTLADPTIYTFPYYYGFENYQFPADGWKVIDQNADGDKWIVYSPYSRTGSWSAAIYTMGNSANNDYLITPPVMLTGAQELKFWVRSWSTTTPDEISILMSSTTPTAAAFTTTLMASTIVNSTNYIEFTVNLSAHTGVRYISFTRKNAPAGGLRLQLDDITIRNIVTTPLLTYAPAEIPFRSNFQDVPSEWKNLTVTNEGVGTLNLTAAALSFMGADAAMFEYDAGVLPFALSANQSAQLPVRFTADGEGEMSALLRISYGGMNYDVALSGVGLPSDLVVFTGDSLAQYGLPVYPHWRYTYSQSIYPQDEINRSGMIEKLYFHWHGVHGAPNSNAWTIYMMETWEEAYDESNTWFPIMDLTTVFSGSVELPPYKDWIEITLDTPFYYTNTDSVNLVIAVDENNIGFDESSEAFLSYPVSADRSLLYYGDTNILPENPIGGTRKSAVPELLLKFSGGTVQLEPPVAVIYLENGNVKLDWEMVTGATSYKVYGSGDPYAPDPWTLLDTTTLTDYIYMGGEAMHFFKVVAAAP